MTSDRPSHHPTRFRARAAGRGFTLVEATVSAAVVGVMFVAALAALGASTRSRHTQADRARGQLLAEDMLAEVLQQAYKDPAGGSGFGPDAGETSRTAFNDVDDYDGYVGTTPTPRRKDGTAIQGLNGWNRRVSVAFVEPADLTRAVKYETGLKRVTVTATYNGTAVATVTSVIADVSHDPEGQGP